MLRGAEKPGRLRPKKGRRPGTRARLRMWSLGLKATEVDALLAEQDEGRLLSEFLASVPDQAKRGEVGRGRSRCDKLTSKRGTAPDYLAARLKRDRPDIAERINEFTSIRAAAIEAGIVGSQSPAEVANPPRAHGAQRLEKARDSLEFRHTG